MAAAVAPADANTDTTTVGAGLGAGDDVAGTTGTGADGGPPLNALIVRPPARPANKMATATTPIIHRGRRCETLSYTSVVWSVGSTAECMRYSTQVRNKGDPNPTEVRVALSLYSQPSMHRYPCRTKHILCDGPYIVSVLGGIFTDHGVGPDPAAAFLT